LRAALFLAGLATAWAGMAWAQPAPPPSQVAPPVIAPSAPSAPRISLPNVPAGAAIPEAAKKLSFVLTGVDVEGEFDELAAARHQLTDPLIGKRITVAVVLDLADKVQQAYVRAGYVLVRVFVVPQELGQRARVKLRVIDGFVERIDVSGLSERVQRRVSAVIAPLLRKTHLQEAELERRLLIAGETAGLQLQATFAAGKEVGGTVLITTGDFRPVAVSVYTDNALPRAFGTGQVVTSLSENSLFGVGEQFSVQAAGLPDKDWITRDPTRRYLTALGTIPIGIEGLRLDLFVTNGITTPRVGRDVATRGVWDQQYVKLSYPVLKRRDYELTFSARFEAEDQRIESLVFTPPIALSLDRIRPLRGNFEGIWRLRESGTVIVYGATVSRGLNVPGTRTMADADVFLPLSRAGADAIFTKADGHFEVTQSLPSDFFFAAMAFGQTSFRKPLLTPEQYDISGSKMLSGFTTGSLVGDSAWALRGELGRPLVAETGNLVLTPYTFGAWGERILWQPSVLEIGSVHATDVGGGMRLNIARPAEYLPSTYGFFEVSRRVADAPMLSGWRIFTGVLISY
jgi:hemolysin activation/secretion protein